MSLDRVRVRAFRLLPERPASISRMLRTAVLVTGLLLSVTTLAGEPVSKSRFGGVAIGGHDTAAYFELDRAPQAQAVEGSRAFSVNYKGAKWRFADAASAKRFRDSPESFAPAYNGHCANALSLGEGLVRTDGTHWEIHGERLFLFYAAAGRQRWQAGDWQRYRAEADSAWKQLSQ